MRHRASGPNAMDLLLAILALLLSIVGIVGCIVPAIPGNALCYVGLLLAAGTDYADIDAASLVLWFVLTLTVIAADFYLPAWMTRRAGGTRAGAVGATVGLFAGILLFPPFGILFGPFFGAVLGELTHDKHDSARAFRSGLGSFLAFIVGTGLKLVVALWMFSVVAALLWPALKNSVATIF